MRDEREKFLVGHTQSGKAQEHETEHEERDVRETPKHQNCRDPFDTEILQKEE